MSLGGQRGAGGVRGLWLPRRRQQDGAPVAGCDCPHRCAEGGQSHPAVPQKSGCQGTESWNIWGQEGSLKATGTKDRDRNRDTFHSKPHLTRPPSLPGTGHKHLRGSCPCPSPPKNPSLHPIKPTRLQFKTFIPCPVPPGPAESFSPFSSQGLVGKAWPWPGAARGHWGQRW